MIIFFTEEDMISFGNYMLSEERAQNVNILLEKGLIQEDKKNVVNENDLQNWAMIKSQE